MWFAVLGSLEVRRGDAVVPIGGARQRTLLAALLAAGGDVVSVDWLTDALWGDRAPADPRNALQTSVARLRGVLGAEVPLVTASPGYALRVGSDEVDARRFEALLSEAQRDGQPAVTVRDLLDEALGLWRGPAYAEFADGVARTEALRLTERRLLAIEQRAEARLALGEAADVTGELEALVAEHPLRERFVELFMRALAAQDRRADALATHRSYRQRLAEETGLEPSPVLDELESRILRGEVETSRSADAAGAEVPATRTLPAPDVPATPAFAGIPLPPTALIGRQQEVDDVHAALQRQRAVTLTGTGGVGKTRLAVEVARSADRDRIGDVAWVDLAPVFDTTAVEHVVADALGIDLSSGRSPRQALLDALEGRHLLLVLDNCEHLLDALAPLVEQSLQRHPLVRVLATSRERLAIDGEWVIPVGPLPTRRGDDAGAVELFVERASAVGARVDAARRPLVEEICRQLDGLPLAIELTAARSGALPLEELLAARQDRGGTAATAAVRRAGPDRHRDLSTVADWSYRLLDEPRRRLFERLSVFAGVFGVDEAHAVTAPGGQPRAVTVEHLASLAEGSLLSVHTPVAGARAGHYRMLRPLARFARERLVERGEAAATADRHAMTLVARAEHAAASPMTAQDQRWIADYLDDLRQAYQRAHQAQDVALIGRLLAALYRYNYWRGGVEIGGWAEEALTMAGIEEQPTAPQVYAAAAAATWMGGDFERGQRLAERGAQLGAGPDDPARTVVFEALGDVATFQGHLDEARAAFCEEVRLARLSGDHDSEVIGLVSVALVLAYAGETDEAIAQADAAGRAATHPGAAQAFAQYARGECRAETAPSEALTLVEEAVELARTTDAGFIEGVALVTSASLQGRYGQPARALPAFDDLLRHWRRSGNWTQQWTTLRNLVEVLVRAEADEVAVVIAAAAEVESTAAPSFGSESDRLAESVASARRRLGEERFAAAVSRGRGLPRSEVVDVALEAIAGVAAGDPYAGDMATPSGNAEEGRAPICPTCGVTALPGDAVGLPVDFACDNADCPAFGERVAS